MTPNIRRRLGACLLLLPFALQAQTLPRPKEFYFDDDASTTRPIVLIKGSDDATIQRLMRTMDRKAKSDRGAATAQLARIAYDDGRHQTGESLYALAFEDLDRTNRLRPSALWNHGWDLYRAGDAAGALERWNEAGVGRFNNPSWVPPTLALALWSLDRKAEAVEWYAAAVRTEPALWRSPDLPALLPDWRAEEHATLAEVAAAWKAAPPAWP